MTIHSPVAQLGSTATRAGLTGLFGCVEFAEGEGCEVRFGIAEGSWAMVFVDAYDSGDLDDGARRWDSAGGGWTAAR